jgi:xylulokinase
MREAAEQQPGADGLCFIPYLAGERSPYWLDEIRGGFYGLRLSHDSRQMLRAVLEGVAFSLRHLLDIYAECGVPAQELALAGGGTQTPGLCQIIADVCGMDVSIYAEEETVTRVLYALCVNALHHTDFDEALIRTFGQPERIYCRRELAPAYESGYATYRRLAAFAAQEAALVSSHKDKEQIAV